MPDNLSILIRSLRQFVRSILKEYRCSQSDIKVIFESHYRADVAAIVFTVTIEYLNKGRDTKMNYSRYINNEMLNDVTREYELITEVIEPMLIDFINEVGLNRKVETKCNRPVGRLLMIGH